MEIRPVRPEEFAEAGRVTALAYEDYAVGREGWWEEYMGRIVDVSARAERTTVLVAVEDGAIVGTATIELDDRIEPDRDPLPSDVAEVRMLGVDPTARRSGLGRALMCASEDLARAAGRTHMILHTNEDMTAARRLYDRLGYRRGEDVVTPSGHVILRYHKDL
jgi:ribosomal protein S18 acetylase RimI-like enzyme